MIRLLCAALALLAQSIGCATGGYYQGDYQSSDPYYQGSIGDVPPSFYDYDPTLRHWFTASYWNPNKIP